jgi:predicted Zn-dependent protease
MESVWWAHEFGHTTGLKHRKDPDGLALMTPEIEAFHRDVTKKECDRFKAGRVKK